MSSVHSSSAVSTVLVVYIVCVSVQSSCQKVAYQLSRKKSSYRKKEVYI